MSEETDQIIVMYYDLVKRWERASGLERNENSDGPTPEAAAFHWRGMENRTIVELEMHVRFLQAVIAKAKKQKESPKKGDLKTGGQEAEDGQNLVAKIQELKAELKQAEEQIEHWKKKYNEKIYAND
jgi:GH18 family chitinase